MQILGVLLVITAAAISARELRAVKESDAPSDTNKESEADKDKEPERPAIHLPSIPSFQIVPQIQFPGFNFPPIRLPQLPSLPEFSLPQFPSLPQPFRRETVFKTKTVFIEHTHRVTRHPVCVTAYVPKPACHYDHEVKDDQSERDLEGIVAAERLHEIQPTSVVSELLATTRVIDNLEDSENDFYDSTVEQSEPLEDQMATYRRMARYLVAHPHKGVNQPEKTSSSKNPTEPLPDDHVRDNPLDQHIKVPHGQSINTQNHGPGVAGLEDQLHEGDHEVVNGLLRATHYVTKTILVTNVEKVIDHKVTATLIAKNCVPSEYIIPHCESQSNNGPSLFKDNANEGGRTDSAESEDNSTGDDEKVDEQ